MHKKQWMLLGALLMAQCVLLAVLARGDSQTIDEAAHLSSGASYITTGSFNLNPEHPAFVKELAGATALLSGATVPLEDPSWAAGDQWNFGRAFLYHNTVPADTLLFLGRLPIVMMTLLLSLAGFLISRALLGARASWITLLFFLIEPTLLAHGHLVTTDVPFALFFFLSIAYFWWAFHTRSTLAAIAAGVFFAFAQITKFSALMLFPILLVTGAAAVLHAADWRTALRTFGKISLAAVAASIFCILCVYGFRITTAITVPQVQQFYDAPQAAETDFPLGTTLAHTDSGLGAFAYWAAQHIPIPALDFFRGAADVALHNYYGHTAYLLGQLSTHGWWYYFPVALFAKMPAALFVLAVLGVLVALLYVARRPRTSAPGQRLQRIMARYRSIPLSVIVFSLPPLLFFIISLGSHINLGVRHMLPMYPFIFLLATVPFLLTPPKFPRVYKGILWSIIGLFVLSVAIHFPYYLSYFSEFIGGRSRGPAYLLDSNYDWGQDVRRLRTYLAEHTLEEPVSFSYFGSADIPAYLGRGFARVPTEDDVARNGIPTQGTIIISAGNYYSVDGPYRWLWNRPATAMIGTSIFVFTFDKE